MSARATDYSETGLGRTSPSQALFLTREAEPVPSLLRRLANETATLFAKELALATTETTNAVKDAQVGLTRVAKGGAVMFVGLIFLLLAAVYALMEYVQPWLAALIVGGVATLIGAIMLVSGRRKLEARALAPRHTTAAIRKDADMIKGATHEH
jgi:hypothetical protein